MATSTVDSPEVRFKKPQSAYVEVVNNCRDYNFGKWGAINYFWETEKTLYPISIPANVFTPTRVTKREPNVFEASFDIIALSNEIFKEAKPLPSDMMGVLNKNYRSLLSKYPARK